MIRPADFLVNMKCRPDALQAVMAFKFIPTAARSSFQFIPFERPKGVIPLPICLSKLPHHVNQLLPFHRPYAPHAEKSQIKPDVICNEDLCRFKNPFYNRDDVLWARSIRDHFRSNPVYRLRLRP